MFYNFEHLDFTDSRRIWTSDHAAFVTYTILGDNRLDVDFPIREPGKPIAVGVKIDDDNFDNYLRNQDKTLMEDFYHARRATVLSQPSNPIIRHFCSSSAGAEEATINAWSGLWQNMCFRVIKVQVIDEHPQHDNNWSYKFSVNDTFLFAANTPEGHSLLLQLKLMLG